MRRQTQIENKIINSTRIKHSIPLFLYLILVVLGLSLPDHLWGIHFISFLPPYLQLIFFTVPLLLAYYLFRYRKVTFGSKLPPLNKIAVLLISIACGILFYTFPLALDFYGNARGFASRLPVQIQELPSDFWSKLFTFKFEPGQGRHGVTQLVELISYYGNTTIKNAFIILDTLCGFGYVVILLTTIKYYISKRNWQWIIAIIALSSPIMLNYFGHIETYALVYLLLFTWGALFCKYLSTKRQVYLFLLLPLLIVAIRFHTLNALLIPAFLLGILYTNFSHTSWVSRLFTVKAILFKMIAPLFLIGLGAYFFVFEDYNDPRTLDHFQDIDRLFLPIVPPDAPLDQYHLFSTMHFIDLMNMAWLWSPALLFILGYFTIKSKYYTINWNNASILLIGLCITLYCAFFFGMNPLFSLPMDWDLFMFPVPLILLVLILIIHQLQDQPISKTVFVSFLLGVAINIPVFLVFFNKSYSANRMVSVGKHIYHSYYEHASTYILYGLQQVPNRSHQNYLIRESVILEALTPYGQPVIDKQLSELYLDHAINQSQIAHDYESARESFKKAWYYYPIPENFIPYVEEVNQKLVAKKFVFNNSDLEDAHNYFQKGLQQADENNISEALNHLQHAIALAPTQGSSYLELMTLYFQLGAFDKAHEVSNHLIKLNYPNREKALQMGLHTALEADKYDKASQLVQLLIKEYGTNQLRQTIYNRLIREDRIDQLKFLFQRSK